MLLARKNVLKDLGYSVQQHKETSGRSDSLVPLMLLTVAASIVLTHSGSARQAPGPGGGIPPARVVGRVTLAPAAGNGAEPEDMALDAGNHRLYVLNYGTSNISVVDLKRHTLLRTIAVPGMPANSERGSARISLDPIAGRILVLANGYDSGRLITLSADTLRVTHTRSIHADQFAIAVSPRRHEVFVARNDSGSNTSMVDVFDTRSLSKKSSFNNNALVYTLGVSEPQQTLVGRIRAPLPEGMTYPPAGISGGVYINMPLQLASWNLDSHKLIAKTPIYHVDLETYGSDWCLDPRS